MVSYYTLGCVCASQLLLLCTATIFWEAKNRNRATSEQGLISGVSGDGSEPVHSNKSCRGDTHSHPSL